jgi:hypothetical protein
MPQSSSIAGLTDVVNAIEVIDTEMAGVTLAAFEADGEVDVSRETFNRT